MTLTIPADFTFELEIALIGHQDHRERVLVLHAEDLLLEHRHLLKGKPGRDGVDEKKPFAGAHVLVPHGSVMCVSFGSGVEGVDRTYPYSCCPAVSRISSSATSSSIMHCLRYESDQIPSATVLS